MGINETAPASMSPEDRKIAEFKQEEQERIARQSRIIKEQSGFDSSEYEASMRGQTAQNLQPNYSIAQGDMQDNFVVYFPTKEQEHAAIHAEYEEALQAERDAALALAIGTAEGLDEAEREFYAGLAAAGNCPSRDDEYDPDVSAYYLEDGIYEQAPSRSQAVTSDMLPRLPDVICFADLQQKSVNWLWDGWIPRGMLTIIAGEQGVGKSTLVANIAANETRKGCVVLYQNTEDDPSITTKQRFIQANAVQENIITLDDSKSFPYIDDKRRENTIREYRPSLVVLDPVMSFIPGKVDTNKANAVREKLMPLIKLAKTYGCSILAVSHLTKSSIGKVGNRVLGSVDFVAAARQVLIVGYDPNDSLERAMTLVKSNIYKTGASVGYRIDENGFRWTGRTDLTADVMFDTDNKKPAQKLVAAKDFISSCISSGMVNGVDILKAAKAAGFSITTIRRARESLRH